MAKSKNKTVPESLNVDAFIDTLEVSRKNDCKRLVDFFSKITGEDPVMWGTAIVGFGNYHYKYESGREGDFFHAGFSPRKQNLTIYIMAGFGQGEIMSRLGKFKTGKSCLYVKRLDDINLDVLEELVHFSIKRINEIYPPGS